ncbi:hypothetical protein JW707_01865 [Candidatus Woesearchaeota archaeon]|nr:hypothetical protein [Candidatus Woesearchaeota archaeon]
MKEDKEFKELEKQVKTLKVGVKNRASFKKYGLTLVPAVFVAILVIGFVAGWFNHSPAPTGYAAIEAEKQGGELPAEQSASVNEEISEEPYNLTAEGGEPTK